MPAFGPIKRRDLLHCFQRLGFKGPYSGGKHQYMTKDGLTIRIPNPHKGDISRPLLATLLKQAKISKKEWERLSKTLITKSDLRRFEQRLILKIAALILVVLIGWVVFWAL